MMAKKRRSAHSHSAYRGSSRLAKHEQKRMVQQSAILIIAALVLGLIFIFFVVPFSINFFFRFLDKNEITIKETAYPPQVPILSAPPKATAESPLEITGFGQVDSTVILILNGQESARQIIGDEGDFAFKVDLNPGDNTIALYATTDKGGDSEQSKEYTVNFDNQAPEIRIDSPDQNSEFVGKEQQNITITGSAEAGAKVYVNGRLNFADGDGNFSVVHRLDEGQNDVEIKADDEAGNESIAHLIVTFKF